VNGYEFTPPPQKVPDTQSACSGGPPDPPPKPPKLTGRDLLEPGDEDKTIFVAGYIEVRELAEAMKLKPFKVIADLMKLKIFKHADELLDVETAANVARKHGFKVKEYL
jgi:translation initiation factor IF-2